MGQKLSILFRISISTARPMPLLLSRLFFYLCKSANFGLFFNYLNNKDEVIIYESLGSSRSLYRRGLRQHT
jgi:hypothetical protein